MFKKEDIYKDKIYMAFEEVQIDVSTSVRDITAVWERGFCSMIATFSCILLLRGKC